MTHEECDVVVVGAGPAGTASAIHLQRRRRKVVVIDKAAFPRDKCCGDGLTTSALRQLELLGLDPKTVPSWTAIEQTVWRSPSGRELAISLPGDGVRFATARRADLDAAMVALAVDAGVDVRESCALEHVETAKDRVLVTTADGTSFSAAYVVAADGMWSPTRKMIGLGEKTYLGQIHAFRQYFTNVTGFASDRLWVSFERDLLPGYLWSFPVGNGCVNVGFGVERRNGMSAQTMKHTWETIKERAHFKDALGHDAVPEAPHKAWPIPANIDVRSITSREGRVMFVGDAARAADPLTGEGIGQAMEMGTNAAASIVRHFHDPKAVARHYRRTIRYGMKFDHEFARALLALARHGKVIDVGVSAVASGHLSGAYPLRWAFEDNPRAGLLTPWRWRERFREKAGAYA